VLEAAIIMARVVLAVSQDRPVLCRSQQLSTAASPPILCRPQIDDPSVFPGQFGEPFPPNFMDVVRTIFKRLFRVYAHIYHSHFKQVCFCACVAGVRRW
jgi:hypothetical protein